jgi:hypothetical protein
LFSSPKIIQVVVLTGDASQKFRACLPNKMKVVLAVVVAASLALPAECHQIEAVRSHVPLKVSAVEKSIKTNTEQGEEEVQEPVNSFNGNKAISYHDFDAQCNGLQANDQAMSLGIATAKRGDVVTGKNYKFKCHNSGKTYEIKCNVDKSGKRNNCKRDQVEVHSPPAAPSPSPSAASSQSVDSIMESYQGKTSITLAQMNPLCKAISGAANAVANGFGMSGGGSSMTYNVKCSSEPDYKKFECAKKADGTFKACCFEQDGSLAHCFQDTKCTKTSGSGWSCPVAPNGEHGKQWVAAHNVYRCMHNISNVAWSQAMTNDTRTHFEDKSVMEHTDSYALQPPKGPAGENLFQASYQATPLVAVAAWYSEIKDCGDFPGCKNGATGTVGHFTVVAWDGAKKIGCYLGGRNKVTACRYKAADQVSCKTPNYGSESEGSWKHTVFKKEKLFKDCVEEVRNCAGLAQSLDQASVTKMDQELGYET